MKKLFLFASLILALSLSASAQYDGFSFGFKVGPNLGWTGSTTGAATNKGVKAGFDLGVVAEYYFAENYAIVSGVNVDFARGRYTFNNALVLDSILTPYGVDRTYKTTVFEIPLMLKMVTDQFGELPIRYYAQVGGGIGFASNVMVKDESIVSPSPDEWGKSNKEFSNFRASLKVGAGAQYSISGTTSVFAGLYFSHDLVNNINSISPNHYANYYDSNLNPIGSRDPKLNLLQNRIGLEVGIMF